MSSTFSSFQSRFGFHPCNYETYLQLRFLHKHYWLTLRQFHAWHRWYVKEPHNRRGTEPKFCQAFVTDEIWFKPYCRKDEKGYRIYPRRVLDHGIVELYRMARIPQAKLVEPFEDSTLTAIESLYREVRNYLSEHSESRE